MSLLEGLNQAQKEAAQTTEGPVLILAGAGTGKTKTITTRLAYLLSIGIPPENTLTLTFTNKAATEMRERAMALIEDNHIAINFPPKLFTFHKFGLLFLRFHMEKLGRNNNFLIIDSDDKKRIIKQFIEDEELSKGLVASEISNFKNHLLTPKMVLEETCDTSEEGKIDLQVAKIYEQYENYLESNNLVDFDDLLMLPYLILRDNPDLRDEMSRRYQYIMIDEFQDTNELQLSLIRLLCTKHNNLCVVGDDDQSIYGWRGANIKNILEFENTFEGTTVIRLQENYRSTKFILDRANKLISHNKDRHEKKLIPTITDGEDVEYCEFMDERLEADFIGREIDKLTDKGINPSDIAVLYRINALSRSIEEGLSKRGIQFTIVDSVRFYERMEVKDAISYLRVIINPHDDFSFKRVVNKPKRGIGKTTLDKLTNGALEENISIFDLIDKRSDSQLATLVGKKNTTTLKDFIKLILDLKSQIDLPIEDFMDLFEKKIAIREFFHTSKEEERALNIDELYGAIIDHIAPYENLGIEDFLNEIALESGQDKINGNMTNLMSIHASKGLEFEYVFIIGLEEGFFPIISEGSDLEEERRLGYVAFTRAKKRLILSSVKSRFFRGKRKDMVKSRFLSECEIIEGGFSIEDKSPFRKGDLVKHKIFGMGRIVGANKSGKDFKLKINFSGTTKEILSNFVEKI
ncbi:MAG: UvrD-helicase domain-containing protein [Campylobacterales bacterium]|nr:UvrD-helicase domain-containing protein [Campylobacterales bacterium]